jgi:uncharacterized secreted protein with C-terminal beta-propeller domain
VLDLADPSPKVVGDVGLPGFSALHPLWGLVASR